MKRALLIFAFSIVFVIPGFASVTVEEMTDAEYVINSGFSQAMAEDIFMLNSRVNGKAIEPLYEKPQSPFVKNWFRFWAYIDPARENIDRIHHDIEISPSINDL